MDPLICYCFNYRKSDIINDLKKNGGRSTIESKIVAAKQRGDCQCVSKHPEGR